jgi:predicted metal-dependent enzyme (double-stranded beta helix superfamily)
MTVALTRSTLPLTELTSLVRTVAASPELWQPLLRVPDAGGQRWWARLSADDRADVWLLSWLPGHATELHDHGPSAAAFSVVRGRLVEVRADARGHRTGFARGPGSVTWLAPGVIHDVRGGGRDPSVSIHAYSPPLRQMNYYTAAGGDRLRLARSVPTDQPEEPTP